MYKFSLEEAMKNDNGLAKEILKDRKKEEFYQYMMKEYMRKNNIKTEEEALLNFDENKVMI